MKLKQLHSSDYTCVRVCQAGFSLTELIVVIFLITTILAIAIPSFNSWQVKYNVEAQVKQMATDINELRLRAMTRKQRHSVELNANNYVFRSYSSDDEPLAGGTVIPGGTYNVSYSLKSDATTFFNNNRYEINQRGLLVSSVATIYLDRGDPAYLNCLTLHIARTNVGNRNASWSNCDDR